LYLYGIKNIVL